VFKIIVWKKLLYFLLVAPVFMFMVPVLPFRSTSLYVYGPLYKLGSLITIPLFSKIQENKLQYFYLLWCNAVSFSKGQPRFHMNMSHSSSRAESKRSKRQDVSWGISNYMELVMDIMPSTPSIPIRSNTSTGTTLNCAFTASIHSALSQNNDI
jgi:hypothetical protein